MLARGSRSESFMIIQNDEGTSLLPSKRDGFLTGAWGFLTKTELTALAAGAHGSADQVVRPEASVFGSQGNADS